MELKIKQNEWSK